MNPSIPHQNNGTMCLSYINYRLKRRQFIDGYVQPVYTALPINNYLKRTSAIKVATMKITLNFCYKWKLPCAYQQIHTFHGEQDEWDTKKGHGNFMKSALYVQWYSKRQLKQQKNKAHSLSHCQV